MNAETMLDQLGEFQAQADYLEMERKRLTDEVKVPDEVLSVQTDANRKRYAIDADLKETLSSIREQEAALLADVKDPEMPPEFVAALAAARAERDDIRSQASDRTELAQKRAIEARDKIDAEVYAKTQEVYNQVAVRKQEINAEFDDKAKSVLENIAKLTADVKAEVVQIGHSVKGTVYQAVYVKGRVTWITDMLDGMMIAFPELAKARKEGQPSVTLRRN